MFWTNKYSRVKEARSSRSGGRLLAILNRLVKLASVRSSHCSQHLPMVWESFIQTSGGRLTSVQGTDL